MGDAPELEEGAEGLLDKLAAFPIGLLQRCGVSARASMVLICVVIWWSSAIYVTAMFKKSTKYSMPFFTLTFLVNTTCGIISFVLSKVVLREGPLPKMTNGELTRVVGLGLIAGCEFGCLNKSLEGLAVSERTMLQNMNVLLIMAAARLCKLEYITALRVVAGLLLVGGGFLQCLDSMGGVTLEVTRRGDSGGLNVAGTHLLVHLPELSAVEQDRADSHAKGLTFMLCSMLLTAVKWSLIQIMTQKSSPGSALGRMSKLQLAYRAQPITGLVCFGLAAFFERCALCPELLLSSGMMLIMPFISIGIVLITVSELKVVQLTSAVATAVLMNLHHIPMVLVGVILFQETVSVNAAVGFVLTCGGGIAYAMAGKQEQARGSGDSDSSSDSDDEEEDSAK
ncbi:unnamed protein product [Prorocentrum cordatum]|uniref:EamA domain-containing protein n=1 Tax=Prorocentrum cordatum TaxID=2364126 RepID=A0ABN9X9M9_9DINO|nr:unnamed protein product [Polarella glacialis]